MVIMDGKTPKGRVLKPKQRKIDLKPITTRKMTAEEWEKYGEVDTVKAEYRKRNIASLRSAKKKPGQEPTIRNASFAEKVKAEREKRGLSTYKMAEMCALAHATIVNIEKGKPCRPRTVNQICEVFGWGKECFQ